MCGEVLGRTRASSSCGRSSCSTFISSWWIGFCLTSRCEMSEAVSEVKSVDAFTFARTTTFIACHAGEALTRTRRA